MHNTRAWNRLFATMLLAACAKQEPSPSPAPPAMALAVVDAAFDTNASNAEDAGASALAWAEAIRLEKWDEAWRGLEALPAAEKTKPEVRYARGRTALARGNATSAGQILEGLEAALPLLRDDIARYRAEARLAGGPYELAGEYFAARATASDQLKAARAFAKADGGSGTAAKPTPNAARARAAADRVVLHAKRTRLEEAEARAIRVELAGLDAAAAADARWICVHAPDSPFDKEAEPVLARADAQHPLTAEECMARGRAQADAGKANDALISFERAASAPGKPVAHADRLRAKADALFKARGRYGEAASAFTQAQQLGGPHAAEDAFMAARSLARADRDDEAIKDYEALAKRYPRTTWADQAAFHAARLHLLRGRWRDAANGFDAYLQHYASGAERKDATRGCAISHLMAGDYKAARRLFGRIADDEDGLGSARAATMEALASAKDGDKTHAIARWTEIARTRPLSWPALIARARLAEMGASLPPLIEPADASGQPEPLEVRLPPPVDLLHRIGLDADAEDALRERENVVTQVAAGRSTEALCAAYGILGHARRRYQVALQIPNAMFAQAPGPKTRWAWECAYPTPYETHVRAREASERLPSGLIFAVMRQESNFNPDAISPARAVGLLQLLPETARTVADGARFSHDDARLTSPPYNIALGSIYLRDLLTRFRGTIPLAVGGYNGGPDAIARWVSRSPGMDLDIFVERIPFTETRIYVGRVMGNLAHYGYLRDGEAGVPKIDLKVALSQ